MQVENETIDGQAVLHLNGNRLDAAVVVQFKDRFREIAEESSSRFILDMSMVDFMDSSGLGAVVAAMKHLGPGRQLAIAGLSSTVSKVFKLTRMDSVFKIYPSVQDALKACHSSFCFCRRLSLSVRSRPIHIRIDSSEKSVSAALANLAADFRGLGLSGDTLSSTEIVLGEALNNVVEHAYKDSPVGRVELSIMPKKIASTARYAIQGRLCRAASYRRENRLMYPDPRQACLKVDLAGLLSGN